MEPDRSMERTREKLALTVSLVSGVLFLGTELAIALATSSQGVWADSWFDLGETLFLGLFTGLMVFVREEVRRDRVRRVFTVSKNLLLLVLLLVLIGQNVHLLLTGGHRIDPRQVGGMEAALCLLALGVTGLLAHFARSARSPAVRSEVISWAIDTAGCGGMLLAYGLCAWLGGSFPWLLRYGDSFIAVCISVPSLVVVAGMLRQSLTHWPLSPGLGGQGSLSR